MRSHPVASSCLLGLAASLSFLPSARAQDLLESSAHRLTAALWGSPFGAIASLGGDGYATDAKTGYGEVGLEAAYDYRPLRYFSFGAGARYGLGLARGIYGSNLDLLAHFGPVFPVRRNVEIGFAFVGGFSDCVLFDQAGQTIDVFGPNFGPRIHVAVGLSPRLDLYTSIGATWRLLVGTNASPPVLDGVPFESLTMPVSVGLRLRL